MSVRKTLSLFLAAAAQNHAPEKTASCPKNRVGFFSRRTGDLGRVRRSQVAALASGNSACDYKPASGRAFDGNGNVSALVDSSDGTLAAVYEYSPYGELLRVEGTYAASNPYRFSTKFTDVETGLSYYGHRYYSAALGRFINRDPIAEQGGINLYAFAGNNPLSRWDYLGLDPTITLPPITVGRADVGLPSTWPSSVTLYEFTPNNWFAHFVYNPVYITGATFSFVPPKPKAPNNATPCAKLAQQLAANQWSRDSMLADFERGGLFQDQRSLLGIDKLAAAQTLIGAGIDYTKAGAELQAARGIPLGGNLTVEFTRYPTGVANTLGKLSKGVAFAGIGIGAYQTIDSAVHGDGFGTANGALNTGVGIYALAATGPIGWAVGAGQGAIGLIQFGWTSYWNGVANDSTAAAAQNVRGMIVSTNARIDAINQQRAALGCK